MRLRLLMSSKLAVALLIGILAVVVPVGATNQDVVQALIGIYTQAKDDLIGTASSLSMDNTNPECASALQAVNKTLSKTDSLIKSAEASLSVGNYHQAESLVIRAINMIGGAYQILYTCGIAEGSAAEAVNTTAMGQLNRTQMLLLKVMNAVRKANTTVNVTLVMEHLREAERLMQRINLLLMQNRTSEAVSLMVKVEIQIREAYKAMERITERAREHMRAHVPENATIVNMSRAPKEVMERAKGIVKVRVCGNSSAKINITHQHKHEGHGHGTPANITSDRHVKPKGMKGVREEPQAMKGAEKGDDRGARGRGEEGHAPSS